MKPDGDCLRASGWFVADCDLAKGQGMVRRHHYAGGGSNTAVAMHGLYRTADESLHGVTWWLPPVNVSPKTWPTKGEVLSLSRMVILPETPKNAATFLLARSSKRIGLEWQCLVTYADTWRGHTGLIYKAAGWEELGMTKPEAVYTIDGRMVSKKIGPRTRSHAEMIGIGATFEGKFPKHRFRFVRKARARRVVLTQLSLFTDQWEAL